MSTWPSCTLCAAAGGVPGGARWPSSWPCGAARRCCLCRRCCTLAPAPTGTRTEASVPSASSSGRTGRSARPTPTTCECTLISLYVRIQLVFVRQQVHFSLLSTTATKSIGHCKKKCLVASHPFLGKVHFDTIIQPCSATARCHLYSAVNLIS